VDLGVLGFLAPLAYLPLWFVFDLPPKVGINLKPGQAPKASPADRGRSRLFGVQRSSAALTSERLSAKEMLMDEDAGFLQALLAAPEDDALRLVYADWLEERGDPRGEYLRCQCARAALILPWQRRLTVGRILNLLGRPGRDRDGAEGVRW
jgi:uncharacterized protein (TIGR02996 family)